MQATGIPTIDNAPNVVAEWLNDIGEELDWKDPKRSYLLLHTVLHAVRDWLNVDEAADLSVQLPILVRGIYCEGWNPSGTPVHPRRKDDFVERITSHFNKRPLDDPDKSTEVVLGLLERHVSDGEIAQVRNSMRKRIRDLWP